MTEPKAHYRLTSIEGVRPKGTQRPSAESMEVLRQHLEEAGVPRPKGGRPAMIEYTPTTEEVQERYTHSRYFFGNTKSVLIAGLEFDRWLAERDRQVREELWDQIVPQYAHDWYWHDGGRELNPYRKETTGD